MIIDGNEVSKANEDYLVIPRGTGKPIVFKGQAVMDFEEFNALCPKPEPPRNLGKGGQKIADPNDKGYIAQFDDYLAQKLGWTIIKTLEPSNIEWTTVEREKKTTWTNWAEELREAGFTAAEQQRIMVFVLEVNCLDEKKMQQARADFLRGQEQAAQAE